MPFATLLNVVRISFSASLADRVPRMGAALAFYSLLSLGPLLYLAINIAGLFYGAAETQGVLVNQLGSGIGHDSATMIENILQTLAAQHTGGLLGALIGLAILLLTASGLFAELQSALDDIFHAKAEPERSGLRRFVRNRLLSFLIVLGTGFFLFLSLITGALLSALREYAGNLLPWLSSMWQWVDYGVSFLLLVLLFGLVLKFVPSRMVSWRMVWPGAILAALLFQLGKLAINYYIAKAHIASGFGAAGSLVVLLIWIYYSAQIILFSAEFSCAWHRRRAVP